MDSDRSLSMASGRVPSVGGLAPMRYYDPSAILVDGQYDLAGAAILLAAAVVLVVLSQQWFARKDVN